MGMWAVVEPDGSISMKVFMKETHTNRYLTSAATTHWSTRAGVIRMLMNRVDRLVSGESELRKEREYISKALQIIGYHQRMFVDS